MQLVGSVEGLQETISTGSGTRMVEVYSLSIFIDVSAKENVEEGLKGNKKDLYEAAFSKDQKKERKNNTKIFV